MASWRTRTKIARSGSINQRHGSADPDSDPHQNVMDPQHCYSINVLESWRTVSRCDPLVIDGFLFSIDMAGDAAVVAVTAVWAAAAAAWVAGAAAANVPARLASRGEGFESLCCNSFITLVKTSIWRGYPFFFSSFLFWSISVEKPCPTLAHTTQEGPPPNVQVCLVATMWHVIPKMYFSIDAPLYEKEPVFAHYCITVSVGIGFRNRLHAHIPENNK